MNSSFPIFFAAGGGFGGIVRWFIQIVIYDICITGIQDILGVSRMVALFIFPGLLMAIDLVGNREFPQDVDHATAVHRSRIEQAAPQGIDRSRGKVRSIPMVVDSMDVVDLED